MVRAIVVGLALVLVAWSGSAAAQAPTPAYRWNLAIPEKLPTGGGNGKLVLFDVSHGGTAGQSDWVIDGGFSDFADALVQKGYTVREYRGIDKNNDGMIRFFDDRGPTPANVNEAVIEFDAIDDADVFVMAETNRPLTKEERSALLRYVAAGKGLFLIADHYNADRNLNSWDATEVFNGYNRSTAQQFDLGGIYGDLRNPGDATRGWLAENFGLRFRFNAINCKPGVSDVRPAADTEGLTAGVGKILMAAGATLAIVDPARAKGLVYFKTSDPVTSWPNAVEGGSGGLYFGGAAEGPYVAVSKPSAGKAAFLGDSSPVEDKTGKYRNELNGSKKDGLHPGWTAAGNAAVLCVNIVDWLATPEVYVGFSTANGHRPGVATPNPLAPAELDDPADGEPWNPRPIGYDPWNSDTFKPGSYGAPFPADGGPGPVGPGPGGPGPGGPGPGGPGGPPITVAAALAKPDGTRVTVEGVIQDELNDQFGLKLADNAAAGNFLSVQLPQSLRAEFSPKLKPSVKGQKIRIVGKRDRYTSLPGLREVQSIVKIP